MPRRRRCRFCWCLFRPGPRVADRQRACRSPDCQKERRRQSQRGWVLKNPGYFCGRYPSLRERLRERTASGYQRTYRLRHRLAARAGTPRALHLRARDTQDAIASLRLIRRACQAQLLPGDV
jgi:hypothetical protein